MKATGIVRRIDELGRIVVPKEIRKTLRISEGDPLLTTLTEHEKLCETAELQDIRQNLFVNGIVEFATRLGIVLLWLRTVFLAGNTNPVSGIYKL